MSMISLNRGEATGTNTRTDESRGELLIPEEDKLGKLDVDVTEGDDKGLDGEDEGSAEARAVARRMRTAADHMDMEWGLSVA